jgi:lysophospholipase L1-like esterase
MRVKQGFRALLSVAVGAFGLISASFGGATSAAAATRTQPTFSKVVTLGDSYSAGTGIHANANQYDVPQCWRETNENAGSFLAARFAGAAGNQENLACLGAEKPQLDQQIADLALPNGGAGALIMLTAFGNDVRSVGGLNWPDVIRQCVDDRNEPNCHLNPNNQVGPGEAQRIAGLAADSYAKLLNKFPNATIRVLAYPHLMEPLQTGSNGPLACPLGKAFLVYLDGNEAKFIDDLVDGFNTVLRSTVERAAGAADIKFVDVQAYFGDNAYCKYASDKLVNGIIGDGLGGLVPQANALFSSFHPSAKGYQAYVEAVADSVTNADLDGKVVSFRSMCNRSTLLTNGDGSKILIQQNGTAGNWTNNAQKFRLRRVGVDEYRVVSQDYPDAYLTAADAIGTPITMSTTKDTWLMPRLPNGVVEFQRVTNPNAALTLNLGRVGLGEQTSMAANTHSCAQQFQLLILGQGPLANRLDGKLVSLRSTCTSVPLAIQVPPNNKTPGARLSLWSQTANADNQRFLFTAVGDNLYEIRSVSSGLPIGSDSTKDNGLIQMSGAAQRWNVNDQGSAISLRWEVNPAFAIDVPGARATIGSVLQLWTVNTSCAQSFAVDVFDAPSTPVTTTPGTTPPTTPPTAGTWTRAEGSLSNVAAVQHSDGRLEMFGVNSSGQIWSRAQNASGQLNAWTPIVGSLTQLSAVARPNGGAAIVGVNSSGQIWQRTRTDATTWTDWSLIEGRLINVSLTQHADGRLEIVGVNSLNQIWNKAQLSNGQWAPWTSLVGSLTNVSVVARPNGGLYIAGINSLNQVWERTRTDATNWTNWTPVDGWLTGISAVQYSDGRLENYGTNGRAIYVRSQNVSGQWGSWSKISDGTLTQISAVARTSGSAYLAAVNNASEIWELRR